MNWRNGTTTCVAMICVFSIGALSGCGSNDRPTVRQKSIAQGDGSSAATDQQHEPNSLERALERAHADGSKSEFAGFDHAAHAGVPGSTRGRSKSQDQESADASAASDPHAGLRLPGTRNGATGVSEGTVTDSAPAGTSSRDSATRARSGDATGEKTLATAAANKEAGAEGAAAGSPATVSDDPRVVAFGGFRLTAPEDWVREEPPVTFILAAFQLPGARGGATNAQLTITVPVNNDQKSMSRLRDQIREEMDSAESKVERFKLNGHEVILVDSTVEEDNDGENSPATVRKGNYRSLNAMLFVGNSVYFLNCTGPERTVASHYDAYREFLKSLKSNE